MLKTWLAAHWVPSALIMGLMLLALVPVGIGDHSLGITLIYLSLPVYMLHQVEEHTGDRFRIFVNTHMFGGVEALSVADVLWINIPGVWGVNLVALYLASAYGVASGLVAPWLMLVNCVAHVAQGVKLRCYNPGLVTSIILFLPLGIWSLIAIPASAAQEAFGLGVAILIHAGIGVRAVTTLRAKRAA